MPDLGSTFNALAVSTDAILGDALAPYALFSQAGRVIGTIAVDVPIREVHDDSYMLTSQPVEGGTPVSDHYYRQPKLCEMTCGYSDSTAGYQGYVQQVAEAFEALAETRQPFSVSTGKVHYSSMMIVNKQIVTDPQSEYALFITIRLQEVILSTVSNGNAGPQGANQADPASTGSTTNGGTVQPLPTFASGQTIAGYTPATPTSNVGASGIGGSPFNLSGPAV